MFDPKTVVQELYESGLNEREITDALRAEGVEVSQATVNRIRCGHIKRTSYQIGAGLMKLHEAHLAKSA